MKMKAYYGALLSVPLFLSAVPAAMAVEGSGQGNACAGLPSHSALKSALQVAQQQDNGGFGLQMWATLVNRDGVVCAVAFSGANRGSQWPGSRVISAQKANTANAFSLDGLALSTANLYSATQPDGGLYGLQESNPVETAVAYKGNSINYGARNDPMVGSKIGGVNVFGGGLGLYNSSHKVIGGVGVSGDSSCADHNIAWRVRSTLELDYVPAGVSGDTFHPDNIVYDIDPILGNAPLGSHVFANLGVSPGGWGHPNCRSNNAADALVLPTIAGALPNIRQ